MQKLVELSDGSAICENCDMDIPGGWGPCKCLPLKVTLSNEMVKDIKDLINERMEVKNRQKSVSGNA